MFEDVRAPRTDAFNEKDVSDKPAYIKSREPLGGRGIKEADQDYRNALRSLVLVDNFVGKSVPSVDGYSFYYTDNGTHNGEHRLPQGKRTPYETDLGFPLLIKGPEVAAGSNGALVGNHDLAPTVASLGRATVPTYVDGRSIESLFSGAKSADWRDAILSESFESSRNIAPV
jgi:N-acetylglucosamine-6-sulfatase